MDLFYKFGNFLEYNKEPKPVAPFDSIEYRSISNWITSNRFYMRVYKDGTAVLVRQRDSINKERQYVETIEKLTTKIDAREWQSLLEYMQFESLKDKYEVIV